MLARKAAKPEKPPKVEKSKKGDDRFAARPRQRVNANARGQGR